MDPQIRNLRQELEVAHAEFVNVADQLNPAKRNQTGVCGKWSPKEVTAHLVGWDASLKQFIVDIENFIPPFDVHGFNQRSVEARAEDPWEIVMAELAANFVELTEALATVTSEMQIYDRVSSWLGGRIEDYRLHTGQLEAWIGESNNG